MMSADPVHHTRKHPATNSRSGKKTRARGTTLAEQAARSALELQTLQAFRTTFGSARGHDVEVRRIAGISGSQLWALSEIARSEGMTVNALSGQMALHQTTASNLVNALVERKLIRRVRDEADQRVVHLHIATEGKRMLLRAPGPYAGLLVDALRRLDADQLAQLRKSLVVLVNAMQRPATTAAGETLMGE
jgi:MarR family transcriptional regulator, organic hydroperoxide resistance regulator